MKLAYSYQRWSTSVQGGDKNSSVRQSKTADKWLKEVGSKLGYKLANEIFTDDGKSAYKGKHIAKDEYGRAKGELAKFIERVESGSIKNDSVLLIDEFSRFSRLKPFDSLTLFTDVIQTGIGLVFTSSYDKRIITKSLLNTTDGAGILQDIIGEVKRAYFESEERSRKVKGAKDDIKDLIKNGLVRIDGNAPKFFTFVSNEPNNPKCKIGKYVPNDKTALVKEMIKGIQAGKTMYAMAEDFNRRKIETFRGGKKWIGKAIRQILRNPILTGEYLGNKNFVPPLVDKDTFDDIQILLDQNKTNKGNRAKVINIFKGLCYCVDCQRAMAFQVRKSPFHENIMDSPYRYLRCSVQGKSGGCNNRDYIRITDFEVEFFTDFLMKNPTELINDSDSQEMKLLNKDITAKTTELNKLTADISKVVSLLDTMPMDELKSKLAELNKRRDSIKTELDELTAKVSAVQDSPEVFAKIRYAILGDEAKQIQVAGYHIHHISKQSGDIKTIYAAPEAIETMKQGELKARVKLALNDSYTREGLRIMIPSLIGKIVVDTKQGKFYVYNRMGKLVYESVKHESATNSSPLWKAAMQKWTTRTLMDGRVVKVNRK